MNTPRSRRRGIPFGPATKLPVSLQVADQLRGRILLGDLRPGQRLPSERALAGACAVSLPTMHAAVVALTFAGLLETRHGVGIFVATRLRPSRLLAVSLRRASRAELHLLRRDLELAAVSDACALRTDADLHLLWVASSELRRALGAEIPRAIAQADLDLHRLLVGAAKSPLLANVHRALAGRLLSDLSSRAALIRRAEPMHQAHLAILDAIERRNVRQAEKQVLHVLAAESGGTAATP